MQPQIIVFGTQTKHPEPSKSRVISCKYTLVLVIFHEKMVIRADHRHHCQVEWTLDAIIISGSHLVNSIQDVYKKAINQDFYIVDSISPILEVVPRFE